MIKVYHNPRCSKSRSALKWLEDKGIEHTIIRYLDESLLPDELENLLDLLDITAEDLIRKNENVWKERYAHLDLSEDELIMVMIEEPRLMERPIVVHGEKAIIARPAEKLEELFK
jgi:arsenate reductase